MAYYILYYQRDAQNGSMQYYIEERASGQEVYRCEADAASAPEFFKAVMRDSRKFRPAQHDNRLSEAQFLLDMNKFLGRHAH